MANFLYLSMFPGTGMDQPLGKNNSQKQITYCQDHDYNLYVELLLQTKYHQDKSFVLTISQTERVKFSNERRRGRAYYYLQQEYSSNHCVSCLTFNYRFFYFCQDWRWSRNHTFFTIGIGCQTEVSQHSFMVLISERVLIL